LLSSEFSFKGAPGFSCSPVLLSEILPSEISAISWFKAVSCRLLRSSPGKQPVELIIDASRSADIKKITNILLKYFFI